ncbi:MAG TPA: EamA family transporter [Ktedonobacteraceae bacterium]|nr:EamA family transporter [Ktedonobacteraceae bacterium]
MQEKSSSNKRRSSRDRLTGYTMILTASALFGFNGNLSRLLFDEGVTPVTLVECRMLIGGICLLLVMVVGWRGGLKLPRRTWGWMVAFGLSLAMVTYTYFVSISRLPIAIALVIQFSAPAWMALGQAAWRRKLPSPYVIAAILLTFGGIVLLTGLWRQSFSGLDRIGLLFAALSVLAYIAYLLLGRHIGRDMPSITSTAYGALIAAAFWLCVQPPWAIPTSIWTPHRLLLIFLVGIVGMAIPFSLTLGSLRRLDATRVGIAGMLELVSAGLIAYAWLGQSLDLLQITGGVLVMAGIISLQLEKPGVQVEPVN